MVGPHKLTSRLKISRTIEAQDGHWRSQPCLFALPCCRHCQMPSGRPSYHHYPLCINQDPFAFHYRLQVRLCPRVCIAYIRDRSVDEIDFWTEPVVDADGEDVVGEQESGLQGSDRFPGERHVSAAVDHEC